MYYCHNVEDYTLRISEKKAWLKYYSSEALKTPMPRKTAYRYLQEKNQNRLDKIAINYYGTRMSYRELFDSIDCCAEAFAAQGVQEGDMVSFLCVAVPECISAIYALNKLGATANTIDPRLDPANICRMIKESGSKITVIIDIAFPKIRAGLDDIAQEKIITVSAARSLPLLKKAIMTIKTKTDIPYGEGIINWDTFLSSGEDPNAPKAKEAPYAGDRTVAIAYTGGTTGFPKGVMLTNDSMNAVSFNFQYAGLDTRPGERFLGIIPVFSSYGIVCGLHMPLCMQQELLPIPRFLPEQFGDLVRKCRPNHMISTPAFYEMMMDSKAVRNLDLSFLKTMGSGGDTMNEGLEKKLGKFMAQHKIRYPLAQGYGMSEVSAAASFCVNDIYKKGSVGIPSITTTISIFDPDTGEELGYNQIGEICITGPSMMKGYFKRNNETANVMRRHADGLVWIHSGDLGYMDEDGFLFVKGRVKRMITRFDGHKVFPVNIESMVSARRTVHNCCVIGVKDRGHGQGEYPLVLVELDAKADSEQLCLEIYHECLDKLEERGKPVAVLAVDEIPMTGAGKNDYVTLEATYKDFDYTKWKHFVSV